MATFDRDNVAYGALDGTAEAYADELDYLTTTAAAIQPTAPMLKFYPVTYQVIATILFIIVGIAAVVGNVMVILVVWRVPHMRSPTNCYLVSLAVADAITGCVSVLLHSVPENFLPQNTFIYGIALCYIIIPLEYVAFNVSALSITAFTIERYIAICHPMRAKLICSTSRASKIIIGLWIFAILHSSLYIVIIDFTDNLYSDGNYYQLCWYRADRQLLTGITYLMDVVLYYVVPVGLSAVLYSLIGRVLFKSTKMSSNMQSGYEPVPMKTKHQSGNCESSKNKKAQKKLRKEKKKDKKPKDNTMSSRKQVVKMLVVVVTLFGVLWAPYRILVVYNSITKPFTNQWFLLFSRICIFVNSAINPILYNFMSVKFRNAFSSLYKCGASSHPKTAMSGYSQTENTML